MSFVWDPITFINLILCILIVVLGYMGWQRSKNEVAMQLAVAFGLFGISHLATLFGLKNSLDVLLIVIRTLAYLIVTYAVYVIAFKKK
jgi:hypothetical protein